LNEELHLACDIPGKINLLCSNTVLYVRIKLYLYLSIQRLKCDGTRAETRFRLSTKRKSPFKSAWALVQSTTGRRAVRTSLQCLYCSCKPVFCSHVTLTGYPLHSLVPLHFSFRASPCAITFQLDSTKTLRGVEKWS
jgi:hypothetical protein